MGSGNASFITSMSAVLESRTDSVWCVPEESVVRTGDGQAVFVASADGGYTMVPVSTGAQEYGYVAVMAPPAALHAQPVVVNGAYALLSALKNTAEDE